MYPQTNLASSPMPSPTGLLSASSSLSDSTVSLHLTPDGRADSLVPLETPKKGETCFASAHVEHVPFPCALDLVLNSERNNVVGYLQQQNDCFREEYSVLASGCDAHIPWATEALGGCLPEAVNLWIGNHSSETSFHKDHYENLYAVVSVALESSDWSWRSRRDMCLGAA